MPSKNEPTFARPAAWEVRVWRLYDALQEIDVRAGEATADLATRQLEYSLKTFIEESTPVTQPKTRGRPAAGFAEEIAAIQRRPAATTTTALSEIETLVERRAAATKRTAAQCYGEVLSERPELYARYEQERLAGVYAQPVATTTTTTERRSSPVSDLVLGTAEGHIADGDETNIADALQRVFRESPAAYAAWLEESRGA